MSGKRLLVAEFKLETNSFSSSFTDLDSYRARYLKYGDEIIPHFKGVKGEVGGFLDACEAAGYEALPVIAANATPGGKVTRDAFAHIRDALYDGARKHMADGGFAGVLLSLHGAMVTEDAGDGEGELLRGLREIVGPDMPVAAVLDLHANMTDAMIANADILIGYDTNPHIDSYERACETAGALIRMVEGKIRPVMALRRIPVLCPPFATTMEPAATYLKLAHEWEKKPGVISVSMFHGFFRADIEEARMSALAVTDNDPALAREIVDDIARRLIADRGRFVKNMAGAEEGVAMAMAEEKGPVVLADVSDNPGGGAPGDSTHVLKALLAAGAKDAAAFIVDPETAAQAAAAGIGAAISVRLGGKRETVSGTPVEAMATVKTLSNGIFHNKGPVRTGLVVDGGLTAVLGIGGVDVVVVSARFATEDPEVFRRNGIDLADKKIVVVKSAQHYRAGFQPLAAKIIEVDAPGLASQHPANFRFKHIKRPVFPLDKDV